MKCPAELLSYRAGSLQASFANCPISSFSFASVTQTSYKNMSTIATLEERSEMSTVKMLLKL